MSIADVGVINRKLNNYLILAENEINEGKRLKFLYKALEFANDNDSQAKVVAQMISVHYYRGEFNVCKDYCEALLELGFEKAVVYYYLGLMEDDSGNYDSAKRLYRSAIVVDKSLPEPFFALGYLYDRAGNYDRALEYYLEYDRLLELRDLEDPSVLNDIAVIYLEKGDNGKAHHYLTRSLSSNVDYFRALYNSGVLAERENRLEDALRYYNMSINSEPSFLNPYLNISAIFIAGEKFSNAVEILNKGLSQLPNSVDLLYNRACSYIKLGRKTEALEDLKHAYKMNPDVLEYIKTDPDLHDIEIHEVIDGGKHDIH